MVYFLTAQNPYSTSYGCMILDDPRKSPLREMRLLDPESIRIVRPSLFLPNAQVMGQGYAVEPEDAPKKLHWDGGKRPLPDVLMHGSVLVVCEGLRDLIEQFDPRRHQLIPVAIYKNKKGPAEATYYWFNICARIDSVDREHTNGKLNELDNKYKIGQWDLQETSENIIFSRNRIGKHSCWLDPYLVRRYWCSQAFGDAAKAQGFTGLTLIPFSEVE